ncbi:abortive infection family protein [Vibrio casei]|uniref:Abortive infection protein-like C-terminal domain-containing protein n=1 Tax=Vibrio casei TaxID=673372 RepID=A0A368LNG7_9VIBR|nr:abortive infection family protein [Vibrio casei]RCS73063.1 hypothetical protein CIK83_05210 [Vibrio casei]SJN40650.1 hypothetical protein FM109_17320 [Vibrio casei]
MNINLMPQVQELNLLTKNKYRMSSTIQSIQTAFDEGQSGMVVGQCKSLIESFAKSILDEFKVPYEKDIAVGKLVKKALHSLGVGENTDNPKKTREAYLKFVVSFGSNIESAVKGIGELRNDFCPLAHGRSIYQQNLDVSYALFIANQTDSLVWFIHELRVRALEPKEEEYIQDPDFDEYLNDSHEAIDILGDTYIPSEILWHVNPDVYQKAVADYKEGVEE